MPDLTNRAGPVLIEAVRRDPMADAPVPDPPAAKPPTTAFTPTQMAVGFGILGFGILASLVLLVARRMRRQGRARTDGR